jgi:hypothetical protein
LWKLTKRTLLCFPWYFGSLEVRGAKMSRIVFVLMVSIWICCVCVCAEHSQNSRVATSSYLFSSNRELHKIRVMFKLLHNCWQGPKKFPRDWEYTGSWSKLCDASAGPGCSSIGVGFLQEIGPFFTNANGTGLIRNKHTWNKCWLIHEQPTILFRV